MSDYLKDCKDIDEAIDVALTFAVMEVEDMAGLKVELRAWLEQEIKKYRDAAIAASNMVSPQFRDAIRKSVGLPPYSSPLG